MCSPWRLGFAGAWDEAVPCPLPLMPAASIRPAPCRQPGDCRAERNPRHTGYFMALREPS